MHRVEEETLEIRKGGKLVKIEWVFDEEEDCGSYKEFDVTDKGSVMLFEPCRLEEGVTLRDIFLVIQADLFRLSHILRNWCEEYIEEGLKSLGKPYITGDPQEIEYLYLEKNLYYDDSIKQAYGTERPDFGGLGFEFQEDTELDYVNYKKGERVPYGVSFSPVSEIINIPVKLHKSLNVYDDGINSDTWHQKLASYEGIGYTLGDILNGIIWELSFNGSPKSRDSRFSDLKDMVDDIKSRQEEENNDV